MSDVKPQFGAKIPQVHLARGAPAVRRWSRYQATDPRSSLCGIYRSRAVIASGEAAAFTEDGAQVICPFCLDLMREKPLGSLAD